MYLGSVAQHALLRKDGAMARERVVVSPVHLHQQPELQSRDPARCQIGKMSQEKIAARLKSLRLLDGEVSGWVPNPMKGPMKTLGFSLLLFGIAWGLWGASAVLKNNTTPAQKVGDGLNANAMLRLEREIVNTQMASAALVRDVGIGVVCMIAGILIFNLGKTKKVAIVTARETIEEVDQLYQEILTNFLEENPILASRSSWYATSVSNIPSTASDIVIGHLKDQDVTSGSEGGTDRPDR
jgi:hypothetical protein